MKRIITGICLLLSVFLVATSAKAFEWPSRTTSSSAVVRWSGAWTDGTYYRTGSAVTYDGSSYVATSTHTSSVANTPP